MTIKAKTKDAPAAKTEAPEVTNGHQDNEKQTHYTTLPGLAQRHDQMLRASAIADDVIKERGYRTITNAKELKTLGFSDSQMRVPGLLLPLHTPDGQTLLYVFRPDNPRVFEDKKHRNEDGTYKQKIIKYEMPKGEKMRLDVPPRCRSNIGDPTIPLWISEGKRKPMHLPALGFAQSLCSVFGIS